MTGMDKTLAESRGATPEEITAERAKSVPAGRYGTIEEFGATCAFMCSQYAGFMVGQNVLLDGGQFNSTF